MIDDRRIHEIITKLGTLAGTGEVHQGRFTAPEVTKGEAGSLFAIKTSMNMPEALVAAGVASNEQEAQEFLSHLIRGYVMAMFVKTDPVGAIKDIYEKQSGRGTGPMDMVMNILGTGFLIGLAAAGHKKEVTV